MKAHAALRAGCDGYAVPHASLLGRCPADVYRTERPPQDLLTEEDPVDPVANATRSRKPKKSALRGVDAIPFDPAGALLDKAVGATSPSPGR
jgi:hypothetical protein